ncbi:Glutamyl-tRNA(Gln) amidotransferase subunit A [Penicillium subrubescens]|uniref:Glutamyl-tRNA(Gln) amidotransferase subunit A n=1 Tax=Penicillium subrubescens TaxID=1316194 RepID=A0A1Q5TC50_9EURO|nr:Glutamyl-tRNA(Gln) amidotransferase subunit A [Penicillium subrubescens]
MGSTSPPLSLDIQTLTIPTFHAALSSKTTTCTDLIQTYLTRITKYNPMLNSLININPQALSLAKEKDLETQSLLSENKPLPPLHGVPIIVKDNISTKDIPTTAGVSALRGLVTKTDSDVVSRLKDAGAIILAKANLHEFALQGTSTSSAGGQCLNPFDPSRTPGGSSGGTAVAIASGLGLVGLGSDTVNSLRSPASACGIVGFRPSWGRVSTQGVVPVSGVQDVVGPMGGSAVDVRVVFDVLKVDKREVSGECEGSRRRTIRIGILDAYFGLDDPNTDLSTNLIHENEIVQDIINDAISSISGSKSGSDIEFIHINPTTHPDWRFTTLYSTADTQIYEFQERLNTFLQSPEVISPYHSLKEIAESGDYDKNAVTEVFTAPLKDPETFSLSSPGYQTRLKNISILKDSMNECFEKNDIDALVYPHQRQLVVEIGTTLQPRRNGILAALTGRPAICIPAVQGVPVGLELMGRVDCDEELLGLAERIEGILQRRVPNMERIE